MINIKKSKNLNFYYYNRIIFFNFYTHSFKNSNILCHSTFQNKFFEYELTFHDVSYFVSNRNIGDIFYLQLQFLNLDFLKVFPFATTSSTFIVFNISIFQKIIQAFLLFLVFLSSLLQK